MTRLWVTFAGVGEGRCPRCLEGGPPAPGTGSSPCGLRADLRGQLYALLLTCGGVNLEGGHTAARLDCWKRVSKVLGLPARDSAVLSSDSPLANPSGVASYPCLGSTLLGEEVLSWALCCSGKVSPGEELRPGPSECRESPIFRAGQGQGLGAMALGVG